VTVRILTAPSFDGIDDLGYLEAADQVADGAVPEDHGSLFFLRKGMSHPLGWMIRAGLLRPSQFWILTVAAEAVTIMALFFAASSLGGAGTGLLGAGLYAAYPLAIAQSTLYLPTAFQTASIAVSLALFLAGGAGGWRDHFLALGAGAALGLGYLCKEDVALLVPAAAIVALTLRFRTLCFTCLFCLGAAAVFLIEGSHYWLTEGVFLHRLVATSGKGAPNPGHLRIAQIWHWSTYLQSLFFMPYRVGLYWWVGMAALLAAIIRGNTAARFIAGVFVLVALYLQFGSNALGTYVPLPKGSRYTAIVTPALILLLAWWLAALGRGNYRRVAGALAAVLVVSAIPCVLVQAVTAGERTRNTLAAVPELERLGIREVYTDLYSARTLRALMSPGFNARVWLHADFAAGETKLLVPSRDLTGKYVLVDRQSCKVYTSSYEMTLPSEVSRPPADWKPVWASQAYPPGSLDRSALEGIRQMASLSGANRVSERVIRNVNDIIEGDEAVLYHVPER
jgi:hypothetical protein